VNDRGFSLIESLVAVALTLTVMSVVFALVTPNAHVSSAQPEAMDMQQRARVASDLISRDLFMAGAGASAGPQAGPLVAYFAPIIPRRIGLTGADPFTVARRDALSIAYVPVTASQTTLGTAMSPGATTLDVDALPNCPIGRAVCGLQEGQSALVFDDLGHFDFFAIRAVRTGAADVQHLDSAPNWSYDEDDFVAQGDLHTYYFDAVNRQLRHYDGYLSDVVVADNVVDVAFEYFGDPRPPTAPKPPPGVANCLYDAAGAPVSGLETLATAGPLAPLPPAMLGDGPWCGAGGMRFDADLLRVRKVRVTLRIQASQAGLRASGPDYRVPGISRVARRSLPDYTVAFDVSPRNLNLGR
jgi:hypothetical protein